MGTSNIKPLLTKLQRNFENTGLDPETVTEDDKVFNLRSGDPKIYEEYEGTDGDLPLIDLDK
jgi:hypothetical protein